MNNIPKSNQFNLSTVSSSGLPNNTFNLSTVSSTTSDFGIQNNIKPATSLSSNSKISKYSFLDDYQTIFLLIVGLYFLFNIMNYQSYKNRNKNRSTVSTASPASQPPSKSLPPPSKSLRSLPLPPPKTPRR